MQLCATGGLKKGRDAKAAHLFIYLFIYLFIVLYTRRLEGPEALVGALHAVMSNVFDLSSLRSRQLIYINIMCGYDIAHILLFCVLWTIYIYYYIRLISCSHLKDACRSFRLRLRQVNFVDFIYFHPSSNNSNNNNNNKNDIEIEAPTSWGMCLASLSCHSPQKAASPHIPPAHHGILTDIPILHGLRCVHQHNTRGGNALGRPPVVPPSAGRTAPSRTLATPPSFSHHPLNSVGTSSPPAVATSTGAALPSFTPDTGGGGGGGGWRWRTQLLDEVSLSSSSDAGAATATATAAPHPSGWSVSSNPHYTSRPVSATAICNGGFASGWRPAGVGRFSSSCSGPPDEQQRDLCLYLFVSLVGVACIIHHITPSWVREKERECEWAVRYEDSLADRSFDLNMRSEYAESCIYSVSAGISHTSQQQKKKKLFFDTWFCNIYLFILGRDSCLPSPTTWDDAVHFICKSAYIISNPPFNNYKRSEKPPHHTFFIPLLMLPMTLAVCTSPLSFGSCCHSSLTIIIIIIIINRSMRASLSLYLSSISYPVHHFIPLHVFVPLEVGGEIGPDQQLYGEEERIGPGPFIFSMSRMLPLLRHRQAFIPPLQNINIILFLKSAIVGQLCYVVPHIYFFLSVMVLPSTDASTRRHSVAKSKYYGMIIIMNTCVRKRRDKRRRKKRDGEGRETVHSKFQLCSTCSSVRPFTHPKSLGMKRGGTETIIIFSRDHLLRIQQDEKQGGHLILQELRFRSLYIITFLLLLFCLFVYIIIMVVVCLFDLFVCFFQGFK
eukprot:gene6779-4861_t